MKKTTCPRKEPMKVHLAFQESGRERARKKKVKRKDGGVVRRGRPAERIEETKPETPHRREGHAKHQIEGILVKGKK